MSQAEDIQRAKEAFHIAKLALFNVRLLDDFEAHASSKPEIAFAITSRARADNVALPISLMHQATFLQFGYVCLAWLWEMSKAESNADLILRSVSKRFDCSSILSSKVGPRKIEDASHVIRLLRNAVSHARVTAEDGVFVFADKGHNEQSATSLRMTWEQFGRLCEAVLFAVNDWICHESSCAKS